ncbi:MAG: hypothetical protein IT384_33060 [Deltaproteobacteria bacterium]|nr:hypothetical protein [Deltaproteobacteria bacterium]
MPVLLALLLASCGFFHDDDHERMGGRESEHWGFDDPGPGPGGVCDDAGNEADAGLAPDAEITADAGSETPDAGACTISPECPSGSQCTGGACVPCAGGLCACQRDNDCGGDDLCDHASGVCEPLPVACVDLTDEANCLLRADCSPIYAGVNCTDSAGGECTSSDPECTCERYSFTTCADRP